MGEGVTGRGGDGQGQAGRGAGILTRAAGALLVGRVPDHAPRTRGAASRLSHGLRRALGGATPHSVLPVTPQCWGPRPAGSRPRPSVRCPEDPRLGRPSPLPRGAHPASPLLHPFDQTPPPRSQTQGPKLLPASPRPLVVGFQSAFPAGCRRTHTCRSLLQT